MNGVRRQIQAVALCVLVGLLSCCLQGCSIRKKGVKAGAAAAAAPKPPADDHQVPNAAIICGAFEFVTHVGTTRVASAHAGESPVITCPTDYTYGGPPVECGWVDRICLVREGKDAKAPDRCWDQYNLTLKGKGLLTWPGDVAPRRQMLKPQRPGAKANFGINASSAPLTINLAEGTAEASRNTSALPAIVAQEMLRCVEESYAELDFMHAEVVRAMPPYSKDRDWRVRFRGIAKLSGQPVDLLVTRPWRDSLPPGDPELDGKGSAMGRITVNGTRGPSTLKMQFTKSMTDEPVVMGKVFFTIFDVDDGIDGENDKNVTVTGISEYFLSPSTHLRTAKLSGGQYEFASDSDRKKIGHESVRLMWQNSLHRTVGFMFRDTSEFTVTVTPAQGDRLGNLEFTGWSEIIKYGRKVFCQSGPPAPEPKPSSRPAERTAGSPIYH